MRTTAAAVFNVATAGVWRFFPTTAAAEMARLTADRQLRFWPTPPKVGHLSKHDRCVRRCFDHTTHQSDSLTSQSVSEAV